MVVLVLLLVATTVAETAPTASSASARDPVAPSATKNVLFIAVDDMRPSINAFNFSLAHTPNLDQLALEGLTFKRAFVNYVSGCHTPNSVPTARGSTWPIGHRAWSCPLLPVLPPLRTRSARSLAFAPLTPVAPLLSPPSQAFCAPSRNSFMSGRRPDTTRVWNFMDHFREPGVGAAWKSLPEYFKAHGYVTAGSGKLFHPTVPPDNDWPKSWTTNETWSRYYSPECMPPRCAHSVAPRGNKQVPPGEPQGIFHCVDTDPSTDEDPKSVAPGARATSCPTNTTANESRFEYQLEDQRIRDSCTDQLEDLAAHVAAKDSVVRSSASSAVNGGSSGSSGTSSGKGFFLACGFHKPHVPWEFPQEFLKHYPEDLSDIPLADDTYAPQDMPPIAWHYPADVHGMGDSFNTTQNATRARNFRRSYYAAISYTDYNIGVLLDRLDALGLTASTAVVVFGDHGWQLGEHNTWAKVSYCSLCCLFSSGCTV